MRIHAGVCERETKEYEKIPSIDGIREYGYITSNIRNYFLYWKFLFEEGEDLSATGSFLGVV